VSLTVKKDPGSEDKGMTHTRVKRVATYERVSSDVQRDRETIRTQSDALAQRLQDDPTVKIVAAYIDDGVSGTVPMEQRPQGSNLMQAAQARMFDELWVYNVKRLGREAIDLLRLMRQLDPLGIKLMSLLEGEQTGLGYDVQAIVADHDRKQFLRLSADGTNRAAREGRYTGGILPLGYMVEGHKQHARLVPSDRIIWGDWTEAELVRKIYHWLAIERWSCPKIAEYLNSSGVPTAYAKDDRLVRRGQRKERTQGKWRGSRIRNLVVNPVYRGELQYGRRSTKPGGRAIISASIPALVSEQVWQAAQETLSRNRKVAKNTPRVYLLKSVIRCGCCGLKYIGSWGRGFPWYRCNGKLVDRGPIEGRCPAKGLKGPHIEALVWDDIERFLRDPGEILEELARERELDTGAAVTEAERISMENAMVQLAQRRKKAIDLNTRDLISDAELDELLTEVTREQDGVEKRLRELQDNLAESEKPLDPDLLEEVRRRLDEGLDDIQRQEVVRLLVKEITVHTEMGLEDKKVKVLVEYRFPGVVNTSTDRGSWPLPA